MTAYRPPFSGASGDPSRGDPSRVRPTGSGARPRFRPPASGASGAPPGSGPPSSGASGAPPLGDHRQILEQLADSLWTERHVVEYLLFKLVTAKLLLSADERRFVAPALDEVERVLAALRDAEARRSEVVVRAAGALEMPVERLTLESVAERAPSPLDEVFREHRTAFLKLTQEIEDTASENRQLAAAGIGHVRDVLGALTGPGGGAANATYDASGRPEAAHTGPVRLNEVL